jgi:hypothetical protein
VPGPQSVERLTLVTERSPYAAVDTADPLAVASRY